MNFDIANIPFSSFGSYTAFSLLKGERCKRIDIPEGIWMRSVHGDSDYEVMLFELIENGKPVACDITASPSKLTLTASEGHVDICIPKEDVIRIRAKEVQLRITARTFRNHGAVPEKNGNWIFNMAKAFRSYRLIPLYGKLEVDAPWTVKHCEHIVAELSASDDSVAEMAIEELTWMRSAQNHSGPFDELNKNVQSKFEDFCKPFLECPAHLQETAIKAAYVDWSAVVHPHRLLKRPAMYMSKNQMTNVWAWDHAFNALAVCLSDPNLAWDQLMVIFDHQDEEGQIPDFINDVRHLTVFVKPPIHGWILKRMIEFSGDLPPERLEQAYDMLSRWTEWWFKYRDPDGDGLPVYWHGNDSGWDNCSVFDLTFPTKSPDLAAFLIIQMDTLAMLAAKMGNSKEAGEWKKRADAALKGLVDTLWDGARFRTTSTVSRTSAESSDSVFGCVPIILGERLPEDIRRALADEIKRHLTAWGPATEHPDSPLYESNGYWRGPIWAPATMILIDGLEHAGETELANDIAQRFCKLCSTSGFAENFDAGTGAPLCDRAYTWTSSVFLILANKYL